jgi:hypothetical protein
MRRTFTALLLVFGSPAAAMAQTDQTEEASVTIEDDPLAKENWPLSGVDRPLGLSGGMLQLDVNGKVAMSTGAVAKPISLPLSVFYGVTDELQFGLVHTTGLCVSGKESNCTKVYNDLGLQLLYSLFGRGSSLEMATFAQFNFLQISDPLKLSLQIGGALNWVVAGNAAILVYPSFSIGLNQRDAPISNREWFYVPIFMYLRVTDNVTPLIATGFARNFSDNLVEAPLGIGVLLALSSMVDVGARFDFTNVLGDRPDGVGRFDGRALFLWLSLRPL